jgi:hypothetical protein
MSLAMRLLSTWLVAGVIPVTVVAGQTPGTSPEPIVLKVGDFAPVFSLRGSDGKIHRLSDYNFRGKAVVLAWFPKAFTAG